jgi:hypothetical protein
MANEMVGGVSGLTVTVTGLDVAELSPALTFTVTVSVLDPFAVGTLKEFELAPLTAFPFTIHW